MDTDPRIAAAVRAASSPDYTQRVQAAEELSQWADHNDVIPILRRLLLDRGDTTVTERTCQALLQRNDIHGIRLIAEVVTAASTPDPNSDLYASDYIDHLRDAVTGHWWPTGPTPEYLDAAATLSTDPDPTISNGGRELSEWARPWNPDTSR